MEHTVLTGKGDWDGVLASLTGERRRAMEFLRGHLPESDLACYPAELFLRFADHALMLRESAPWCAALDWGIFAHYVLFPRVNDEDLSFHRDVFYAELWPRVRDLPTTEERVLEVNCWCHEHASYQAQDERTASPFTVYRCGSGRCGEESAFLVSALRSVGIPARQVYAPRWSHCDDNHAWVEALCGGRWRFLGACEPEPALDMGWFITASSRAMLVHSRIFGEGESPLHGQPLSREGAVRWFSQTARYAPVRRRTFRVMAEGRPAAGARVELQILNEAFYHTIAVLTTGENGEAAAELGLGDLHVRAWRQGLTAEGECGLDGLVLHLAPAGTGDVPWTEFDVHAPQARPACAPLEEGQKAVRAETLARGNALRTARLAGFSRPGRAEWEDLRRAARGNWDEIAAFLAGKDPERRERLVRTLSGKDLRDVKREILEDHFAHLPPQSCDIPEKIYWQYTACPRIALEPLAPWRGALKGWLRGWTGDPAQLRRFVQELLPEAGENGYANLYWTPGAALEWGGCDGKSRDVLLTAALRTLGIPARLRPLDGGAEYWERGGFRLMVPEETGTLRLTLSAGESPQYRRDWTISRREENGWRLLMPEGAWENGALELTLPAGQYRLLTSVRLPGGDQLAAVCEVGLSGGAERTVPLLLRPWSLDDLLSRQSLPALPARTLDGRRVPDLFDAGGKPLLTVWLEEGGEPTEHVLNELLDRRTALAALPVGVRLLVRGRESLDQPTLARVLAELPGVEVLLDDWAYDLELAARRLGRDPDRPPLMVVSDGAGCAVYSDSGYRVGAVDLLLRVAGRLAAHYSAKYPQSAEGAFNQRFP